jgi:hypothetical protein
MTKDVQYMMNSDERLVTFEIIKAQSANLKVRENMAALHATSTIPKESQRNRAMDIAKGPLTVALRGGGIRTPQAILICKYIYASGVNGQPFEEMLSNAPNILEASPRSR